MGRGKLIALVLGIVIAGVLVFVLLDQVTSHEQVMTATVAEKVFVPEEYDLTEIRDQDYDIPGRNPQVYYNRKPNKFVLLLVGEDGVTRLTETDMDTYVSVEKGYEVTISVEYGGITGKELGARVLEVIE